MFSTSIFVITPIMLIHPLMSKGCIYDKSIISDYIKSLSHIYSIVRTVGVNSILSAGTYSVILAYFSLNAGRLCRFAAIINLVHKTVLVERF